MILLVTKKPLRNIYWIIIVNRNNVLLDFSNRFYIIKIIKCA